MAGNISVNAFLPKAVTQYLEENNSKGKTTEIKKDNPEEISVFLKKEPETAEEKKNVEEPKKAERVTFKKGAVLFATGIGKRIGEWADSIIKHPIRSLATLAATTLGICALPLIGIPSTVGSGVLICALAAAGLIGAGVNICKFIKNNNNGKYEEAEKNMENIGGNTIEMLASLPFVPKAVSNIGDFAKYGKIAKNKTLTSQTKNIEALILDAYLETKNLLNAMTIRKFLSNKSIPQEIKTEFVNLYALDEKKLFAQKFYDVATKDMTAKPDITFKVPTSLISEGSLYPELGVINISPKYFFENMGTKEELASTIIHEVRHAKQHQTMFRYLEGIKNQKDNIFNRKSQQIFQEMKKYLSKNESTSQMNKTEYDKMFQEIYANLPKDEAFEQIQHANTMFNTLKANNPKYYNDLKKLPTISEGTQEAEFAKKLLNASKTYADDEKTISGYLKNFLEVDARNATNPPKKIQTTQDLFLKLADENKKFDAKCCSGPSFLLGYWQRMFFNDVLNNE